jgi:hypothetical protein
MGHTIALSLEYLDQHQNPMLTVPTPDSAPAWSNTTAATETLKVAADGLSCEADPVAPGVDVVNVKVTVGGNDYSASVSVEIDPEPQVLTSVLIKATVSA